MKKINKAQEHRKLSRQKADKRVPQYSRQRTYECAFFIWLYDVRAFEKFAGPTSAKQITSQKWQTSLTS